MTSGVLPVLEGALLDGVLGRLTSADYPRFDAQLRSSGYCARPVRLQGSISACDARGVRRQVWSTTGEPDDVLRKACGNRREAVCGPCAERYRGDAWQLIAAGLRGGKGIPETVTGHPAVFASLTAPSFGAVHAHVLGPDGQPARCRPRRDAPVSRHGVSLACARVHAADEACVGEPLCALCFDYCGAVLWNNLLGELWRRTMIYLPRQLAALLEITQKRVHEQVRVSYAKVAEYQHRGLVHVHPVIRLDRRMPAYRASELRPPDRRFTSELLEQALRGAVAAVSVKASDELGGGYVTWGKQLDVQQLSDDDDARRHKASYLAKYSTKSTEQAGGLLYRVHRDDVENVKVRDHVRGYLRAAFTLHDQATDAAERDDDHMIEPVAVTTAASRPVPATASDPTALILRVLAAMSTDERVRVGLHDASSHVGRIVRRSADGLVLDDGTTIAITDLRLITAAPVPAPAAKRKPTGPRLATCAHQFGYRGHCLTKSRRWSTTFKALRQAREQHVHEQLLANASSTSAQRRLAELAADERITAFEFVGVGHLTTADAYLAAQAAARARENRQLARDALDDHHNRRSKDQCEAPQDRTRVRESSSRS